MTVLYLDKRNVVIGVVTLAVVFCLGIVIGHYGRDGSPETGMSEAEALVDKIMNDQFASERDLVTQALEDVNSDNLRSYLKRLTKEPHIAGSKQDEELVEYIKDAWIDMGLDRVELAEYDFYLSWPNHVLITFIKRYIFQQLRICFAFRPTLIKSTWWMKMAAPFSRLSTKKSLYEQEMITRILFMPLMLTLLRLLWKETWSTFIMHVSRI